MEEVSRPYTSLKILYNSVETDHIILSKILSKNFKYLLGSEI